MWSDFGRLVKKYRKGLDLSLNEVVALSRKCDYPIDSKGTISKWEHGTTRPTEGHVETLEKILQVPNQLLKIAAGYSSSGQDVSAQVIDPRLLKAKEEHWKMLTDVAKMINQAISEAAADPQILSDEEALGVEISEAFEAVAKKYGDLLAECFDTHLRAEFEATGLKPTAFQEKSVIEILAIKGTYKGSCAVCEEWI